MLKTLRKSVSFLYLWFRSKHFKPLFDFDNNSKDLGETGVKSLPEAWFREKPRPLEYNEHAVDSISFQGVNNNGDVIIVSLTRLPSRVAAVWIYLKFANGEQYQLPHQPATNVYNTDGKNFSATGLTFEVLEPLRRWRIGFNGILRKSFHNEVIETDTDDLVNMKFNLIWHPMYNYVSFPHDIKPSILAGLLSECGSSSLFQLPSEILMEEWYEQFGQMSGTVKMEGRDEFEVMVRGLKERRHGVVNRNEIPRKISIMGIAENGDAFHLFADNSVKGLEKFAYGYILPSHNTSVNHVNEWQKDINTFESQDEFSIDLKAGANKYNLKMVNCGTQFKVFEGENWQVELYVRCYQVNFNGKQGYAITMFGQPYNGGSVLTKQQSVKLLVEPAIKTCNRFILTFKDTECRSSSIVGGKASSLASMANLLETDVELECSFYVPNGICLTKHAFESYSKSYPLISKAISTLQDVYCKALEGSLENERDRLVTLMQKASLIPSLQDELQNVLVTTFGENFEDKRFAVRSSAIGEDGEEMSAAGQNESFLGVKKFHNICSAVIMCWASQFSFRSVEYKRQNGQVINGGMGVVIQEMVSADIAGVLFTRHPLTHSPAYIVVASNYGLGESVVSASADPDTVTISRSWKDHLEIFDKVIGTKTQKVTMNPVEQGTTLQENDAEIALKCSISDQLALRLGKIAIDVEHRFGGARDIEWAVMDDKVFLLQSRPVTVENAMTDYELIHEFDTATRTDHECYTTGNLAEVIPGAITPLTMTTEFRSHNATVFASLSCKVNLHRYDPTVLDGPSSFYSHLFFDLVQQKGLTLESSKSQMSKAADIGFFGRVLDDEHINKMATERFGRTTPNIRMKLLTMALKGMFFSKSILKKAATKYRHFQVPVFNAKTAADVYQIIERNYYADWSPSTNAHLSATCASMAWNLIVLNMLTDSDGEFTLEKYTDFATLIGKGNGAESGDVPFSIQELAAIIGQELDPDKFCKMDVNFATDWCNHNSTVAGEKFKEFLLRHGHRGLNEFDLSTVTWGMDPRKLVHVLQSILKQPQIHKQSKETNTESVFDKISTRFSSTKRQLISYFVAKAKQGICYREQSKSMLIKTVDGYRHAYRHLAKMMVQEGLIPDPELIFFLTHEEIGILMNTRSPTLIRRAKQRQRIHKHTDPLVFEEMIVGFPIPIPQIKEEIPTDGEILIKGYPVCQGKIRGTARVVTFEDIGTIQLGDILITRATDIGWSPYFPMLSGVVTEIGGLISHGAVVAREFGLPCIVGAQNATRVFNSGDSVFLNAHDGFITKATS